MENNELLYLCMVAFTCYGFNLAQGLRAAINRGDTVRITPKILCFVFCISVSVIAIDISLGFATLSPILNSKNSSGWEISWL